MHNQTLEFNVMKNYTRTNGNNTAKAKVIINNGSVTYPTVDTNVVEPSQYEVDPVTNFIPPAFYERLAQITTTILATNTSTLIANFIDQSGLIILKAAELVELISILTTFSEETITLHYKQTEETGCIIKKYSPIKGIKSITINNRDLQYAFNKEYNILQNKFKISLAKCFIWD